MSLATVVKFDRGVEDATACYIMIKNGGVYKYAQPLSAHQQKRLNCAIVEANNKVHLTPKLWTKVR